MKVFIILSTLLAVVAAVSHHYKDVTEYCDNGGSKVPRASAKYGHVTHVQEDLQDYMNLHLNASFEYLLLCTRFGGYEMNRMGIERIFHHLSDRTWDDAISLIKYTGKRGVYVTIGSVFKNIGSMEYMTTSNVNVTVAPKNDSQEHSGVNKMTELGGLSVALDSQKKIAEAAHGIHKKSSSNTRADPEVASFLENNFVHRHADNIRNLAGLISDLTKLFTSRTDHNSLSAFLVDEYLKKMSS